MNSALGWGSGRCCWLAYGDWGLAVAVGWVCECPLIDVGVSVSGVGSLRVVWVGMRCLAQWFSLVAIVADIMFFDELSTYPSMSARYALNW